MSDPAPIIDPNRSYALAITPGDDAVEVEFEVREGTLAEVQRLVNEGQYRSVEDFFRDAWLHSLAEKLDDIDNPLQRLKAEILLLDVASREEAQRSEH